MITGTFHGEQEFDRDSGQMRRTYLHVEPGEILLSNMVETCDVTSAVIRDSITCWCATGNLISNELHLNFTRGNLEMALFLQAEGNGIRIIDPKQDEWGGFGGFYPRVR